MRRPKREGGLDFGIQCDWCEVTLPDVGHGAVRCIGPWALCSTCATVARRWQDQREPGTYSVGASGERLLCAECGWPLSGPSADVERDRGGPGHDQPVHTGCRAESRP